LLWTLMHRLCINVHNNDDDDDNNDNVWQRGPLWPHRMGPITNQMMYSCMVFDDGVLSLGVWLRLCLCVSVSVCVSVGSNSREDDTERHCRGLVGRPTELSSRYQLDAGIGKDLWRGLLAQLSYFISFICHLNHYYYALCPTVGGSEECCNLSVCFLSVSPPTHPSVIWTVGTSVLQKDSLGGCTMHSMPTSDCHQEEGVYHFTAQ